MNKNLGSFNARKDIDGKLKKRTWAKIINLFRIADKS